jgi:hypothetical protein
VDRPERWKAILNEAQPKAQVQAVRESIRRNRLLVDERWVTKMAEKLKLTHALRRPGRPRKVEDGGWAVVLSFAAVRDAAASDGGGISCASVARMLAVCRSFDSL